MSSVSSLRLPLLRLKVKIQTLSAEAGIIRLQERRALVRHRRWADRHPEVPGRGFCSAYEDLRAHRRSAVGGEARASLLAYGFLRGRPYAQLEARVDPKGLPDLDHARSIAARFAGGNFSPATWDAWVVAANAHLDAQAQAAAPVVEAVTEKAKEKVDALA